MQLSNLKRVAHWWLLGVVCGCLALFGIILSTNLAQAVPLGLPARFQMAGGRVSRRRREPTDVAASYARFSSDQQDASSIDQQQRQCRDKAQANGHSILAELEFADEAVSGTKLDRKGLNAMMTAARAGRYSTLYVQCLSRLAREFVISVPMLKELVYVCGVRVISVSENIDSANSNWELMAIFRSWMHEEYLKVLRAAVLRGQEDAFLNDFSVGDWCLGYGSEPIPGSELGRRGRRPKPRMRIIINEDHASWVRQVFHWFVKEQRSLQWIARELTKLNAPKDHRSVRPGWYQQCVRTLLGNRKYIAIWPWGRRTNVRNPLTGQVRQEDRPFEEAIKWERERPHLRLVEDEIFFKSQAILDDNKANCAKNRRVDGSGKLRGSTTDTARPRHLLQNLIKCGACDRTFQVGGGNGKYLVCPGYRQGICNCRTQIPRKRAERQILEVVAHRILADEHWCNAVYQETLTAWRANSRST
ncbi:MAG: recombinase family protein, partial [Gemmataceae bacterium]